MKVEASDTRQLSPAPLGKIVSLEEGYLITESDALHRQGRRLKRIEYTYMCAPMFLMASYLQDQGVYLKKH